MTVIDGLFMSGILVWIFIASAIFAYIPFLIIKLIKSFLPKKYIGYREQSLQCDKDGTCKKLKNKYNPFPKHILLCTKYNEICSSKVCAKEQNAIKRRNNGR